ncbi:hypothetical protein FQN50_002207 [Emmonsiellopsis sp. PD_5]|nr:hypothetical protein FQN50_002207 [Emmonsiellopsis sp. PD_5]
MHSRKKWQKFIDQTTYTVLPSIADRESTPTEMASGDDVVELLDPGAKHESPLEVAQRKLFSKNRQDLISAIQSMLDPGPQKYSPLSFDPAREYQLLSVISQFKSFLDLLLQELPKKVLVYFKLQLLVLLETVDFIRSTFLAFLGQIQRHFEELVTEDFRESELPHGVIIQLVKETAFALQLLYSKLRSDPDLFYNNEPFYLLSEDQKRDEFLMWLSPFHPRSKHQQVCSLRAKGTCEWIQDRQEFRGWISDNPTERFLWCHGAPGIGKTVLMSFIIDELGRRQRQTKYIAAGPTEVGLSFIYCDYADRVWQSASQLVGGILKQLLLSLPNVPRDIKRIYGKRRNEEKTFEASDIPVFFQSICEVFKKVYVCVDVPEECLEEARLLELLVNTPPSVQICITSRKHVEALMPRHAQRFASMQVHASDNDIELCIKSRIEQQRLHHQGNEQIDEKLEEEISNTITRQSSGTFLVPVHRINSAVEASEESERRRALESSLSRFNEVFLRSLQKIESQPQHIVDRARRILKHVSTSHTPVDIQEILAKEKGSGDPATKSHQAFIDCCFGLVTSDNNASTASLVQLSSEEYSFLYQWLYGMPAKVDSLLPQTKARPNTPTNLIEGVQKIEHSDLLKIRPKPEGHIITLAEELCKVVRAYQPTDDVLERIPKLLPGLLEDFALHFDGNMVPEMHQNTKMFIISYRGHIATTFRDKICANYPIDEKSRSFSEMSLDERVKLWQSKNAELDGDISGIPPEQRDGIHDPPLEFPEVEEGGNSLPGLQEFLKLIKSAPAYDTLIANIRKECILAQPEPNHMEDIRRIILASLPAYPTPEWKLDPGMFKMEYFLEWDPLTFVIEQGYANPADIAIGDAITLTGSVTTAQAVTCAEYLSQTWPSTGPFVLQLVKDQARCTNLKPLKVTLLDGTILSSNRLDSNQADGTSILFSAVGSANRIAEIGEQLAWLVVAMHSSPDGHGVASCRPLLKNQCSGNSYAWKIGTTLGEKYVSPAPLHGQCWHNLFRNPVVVEGYPIPRRPTGTPGIEIPLRMMAELIQTSWVNPFAGRLVIKGFSQMLVPTEIRGDIIMWHLLQSKEGERIPYSDCIAFPQVEILISNLENFRHVLGWCSEMKFHRDACYEVENAGLPTASGDCLLADTSISEGRLLVGGRPFDTGKKDDPRDRFLDFYLLKMEWISEKFVVLWDEKDKRGWLVNGTSALLHIVLTSLEQLSPAFKSACLFNPSKIQEAKHPHQPDSASELLLNTYNRQLEIFRENDAFFRFQDKVERSFAILEKMIDYQRHVMLKASQSNTIIPRAHLEGWDFGHLVRRVDHIDSRLAVLDTNGKSWVDFTRSIHAVTLFGRGFRDIIQPTGACSAWATLPCGKYYLAACAADLRKIMKGDGDRYSTPVKLAKNVIWYIPDRSTGKCLCKDKADAAHSDLAQILLPSDMCKNISLNPSGCYQTDSGAFIFGFNESHQWVWNDTGDPFRKMADESSSSLLSPGISSVSYDSGIGESLGSPTSQSSSSMAGSTFHRPHSAVFSESLETEAGHTSNYAREASYSRSAPQEMSSDDYTVGILCALDIELMAVRALFDSTHKHIHIPSLDHDPNCYVLGSICRHNVVASCLPDGEYGTTSAALAAAHMSRSFNRVEFYY